MPTLHQWAESNRWRIVEFKRESDDTWDRAVIRAADIGDVFAEAVAGPDWLIRQLPCPRDLQPFMIQQFSTLYDINSGLPRRRVR